MACSSCGGGRQFSQRSGAVQQPAQFVNGSYIAPDSNTIVINVVSPTVKRTVV